MEVMKRRCAKAIVLPAGRFSLLGQAHQVLPVVVPTRELAA
jgi:hypothetical protein